jgi:hypothetical protein
MPFSLTHVAEQLFAALANEQSNRMPFLSVCGLTEHADLSYVASVRDFAFCEGCLNDFGGKKFDGASRVDVVVRLRAGVAAAFELKLGATRLTKKRVNEEWLQPCEPSHDGKRWKGSMMAILDRRFSKPIPRNLFVATNGEKEEKVRLERDWFVVARQVTLKSWETSPPDFGRHVRQVSIENVVHELGGKNDFNALVQRQLKMDFYEEWIASAKVTE